MNELDRIIDQLQRAHNGDAWHGDPLMKILQGVAAESAARKLPGLHSIWELLTHITVWQQESARRLRDRDYRDLPKEQDWPAVTDTSERAWNASIQSLESAHQQLVNDIRTFDRSLLDHVIPGSPNQTYYVVLHGIIQHTLYHAGQIALIKKQVVAVDRASS
jgi:uncharacterized damage-inducible protein DinB